MPRETFIVNRRGETLAGILTTANSRQGDAACAPREKRLAIMCHGFMETRDTFILRRLSAALLEAECSGIDAVFRFDFGGTCQEEYIVLHAKRVPISEMGGQHLSIPCRK